jgi:hypothetical protein
MGNGVLFRRRWRTASRKGKFMFDLCDFIHCDYLERGGGHTTVTNIKNSIKNIFVVNINKNNIINIKLARLGLFHSTEQYDYVFPPPPPS